MQLLYQSERSPLHWLFSDQSNPAPSFPWTPWIFGLLLLLLSLFWLTNGEDPQPFIEYDENGIPVLAEWREDKLNRALEELEGAEQYALLAARPGNYPCFSCTKRKEIFLNVGEVWKYGFTTKGQQGRYGNSLAAKGLHYVIQFEGTIQECLQEEKRKIYHYATLPENLKRVPPLIRPPGNHRDN